VTWLQQHERFGSFLKWSWFEFRAAALRMRRTVRNWREQSSEPTSNNTLLNEARTWTVVSKSESPLWTAIAANERRLVAGKVQNLRMAVAKLNGRIYAAGEIFSFWSAVGPPNRRRGFAVGRELREGCLVATVGGGLCQLSNALHLAALEAGMEIVERHAHTQAVPGSIAATGRDATVFWNYKDLRFRASHPFVLDVQLSATHLVVQFRTARQTLNHGARDDVSNPTSSVLETAEDCVACRHHACVYHPGIKPGTEHTALLLDAYWSEFDAWLGTQALDTGDIAFLPLDGARRNRPGYAWLARNDSRPVIREHPWLTLRRSLRSRHLQAQGAARQRALIEFDRELAAAYAKSIPVDCQRLVVSLNLLPHLAAKGALGGRHVTVLLNHSPLHLLHRQLDQASALYPQSNTISDYRAEPDLVEREYAALSRADLLLTPHAMVAEFLRTNGFSNVKMLPWSRALKPPLHRPGDAILFPASGLARKGAYEVRAACREMDLPLNVLGSAAEDDGFWKNNRVRFVERGHGLFDNVACVVLPAHVEHQPRLLLSALASDVPVICTAACGLPPNTPGVDVIESGQVDALMACLRRKLTAKDLGSGVATR
jgi:VanW like protein